MAVGNDPNVEGFVDGIRLAWAVHLMLILDVVAARESVSNASSNDLGYLVLGSHFLKQCFPVFTGKSSSNCGLPGLFGVSLFSLPNFSFSSEYGNPHAFIHDSTTYHRSTSKSQLLLYTHTNTHY